MIEGHGDDICRHPDIRVNFSSNIYNAADVLELKRHLCRLINLIDHYPEAEPCSLAEVIAKRYGIPLESILVTSGATDAIYLIAQAFGCQTSPCHATIPQPTFSEYEDACRMYGITLHLPASTLHLPASTLLWLCNPNNPTGSVYTKEEIEQFAHRFDVVVLDQSYEDYTLAPMLTHHEAAMSRNILQIHSLTKTFAIPGLRVGYIVGSPHYVQVLRRHLRPWAVGALAVEAGKWLLQNDVHVLPPLPAYLAETERLRQRLVELPGIEAAPTQTSFILAQIHPHTAASLKEHLATNHAILIRDASNFRGLTPHHFRVSTQSPHDNSLLVQAISQFLNSPTIV